MREAILRDYFVGKCTVEDVKSDLKGSMISRRDVTEHPIEDMDVDFIVTAEHLIQLCEDMLKGYLDPEDLKSIGFCIIAADHFMWDVDTISVDRVAEAIHDWSTAEINYALNRGNVKLFRERLIRGGNPFSNTD